MMKSFCLVTFCFAFVVGCGGGDDPKVPDAKVVVDAPVTPDAPTGNPLGKRCLLAANPPECPANSNCLAVEGVGGMTHGWCSPDCTNMPAACTTGYTGPAGGMPQCALQLAQGQPPSGCAIVCTGNEQCPAGLSCLQVPQQQVKICAAP